MQRNQPKMTISPKKAWFRSGRVFVNKNINRLEHARAQLFEKRALIMRKLFPDDMVIVLLNNGPGASNQIRSQTVKEECTSRVYTRVNFWASK